MALTLAGLTWENNALDAMSDAIVALAGATATLKLRNSTTDLVEFSLSNPIGTSVNGLITIADTPISETASAGSATTPDNWQLLAGGSTLIASGSVSGTGAITSGDTVSLNSATITIPASA